MQVPPGNPLLLSLTLQELLARDAVQVELVPEKKGLFLKHVEYEVSSQVPAGVGVGGWREDPPAHAPASGSGSLPLAQAPAHPSHPWALGSCLSERSVGLWPRQAGPGWSCSAGQPLGSRVWTPHRRSSVRAGLVWGAHPQRVLRPHQGCPKVRVSRVLDTWPRGGRARAVRWRQQC